MYQEENSFNNYDRLIKSIAGREYQKYLIRVSYPKLEYEDFYQNGWVAMQDCLNKGISNIDYICVAVRNAMYRGVQKSSIIQTTKKKDLWYYISGHECRLDSTIDDTDTTYGDLIPSTYDLESKVETHVLVGQIFENVSDEDRKEILKIMYEIPNDRRRYRDKVKERARRVLNGDKVYRMGISPKKSDITGVTYDKSKDRWVFSKRIQGKVKTFIRNKDKEVVENYAKEYYKVVNI